MASAIRTKQIFIIIFPLLIFSEFSKTLPIHPRRTRTDAYGPRAVLGTPTSTIVRGDGAAMGCQSWRIYVRLMFEAV